MLTEKPDKKPWMPLWAKDWLAADSGLRMCGLAARGLWIDVLAHMWLRTPRGILTANLDALVNLIGGERETIRAALAELTLHRVHSWYLDREVSDRYTPESELCCRRMYREWRAKQIQREAGARGGRERARKAGQNLKATPKARPRLPPRLGQGYPQGSAKATPKALSQSKPHTGKELVEDDSRVPLSETQPITITSTRSITDLQGLGMAPPVKPPYQIGIEDLDTKEEIRDLGWSGVMAVFCSLEANPDERSLGFWQRRILMLMEATGDRGLDRCYEVIGKVWDSLHPELHKGEPPFTNAAAFANQETEILLRGK